MAASLLGEGTSRSISPISAVPMWSSALSNMPVQEVKNIGLTNYLNSPFPLLTDVLLLTQSAGTLRP